MTLNQGQLCAALGISCRTVIRYGHMGMPDMGYASSVQGSPRLYDVDKVRNWLKKNCIFMKGKQMLNSRSKGARGERELAAKLREMGFGEARRGQQFSGSEDSPDVKAIEGIHIECKRVETLNIHKAMAQAVGDAGGNTPCVIHKRNRGEWMVTLRLDDLDQFIVAWMLSDRNLDDEPKG